MLYYPISALINAVASTVVCLLAITKNPKSALNRSFSYFAFSVAFWSYCYFFWQISKTAEEALFWCRVLMAGAIFIPSTFLHFSITFVDRQEKHSKTIKFWYFASILFLILDFTPLYIANVRPRLGFPYWPTPGIAYAPFLAMFIGLTIYAHILVYKRYHGLSGFERNRIKYVFLGTAIGFLGGSTNYPLWYDIPIPPLGNALVAVYVIMVAYATIKYRLMDVTVFTIRGLTLGSVYILVLGIPFWVGYKYLGGGLWILPVSMMAVLASAGPFIYNFVRDRAEDSVLKEQRRYHQTLLQVSQGMTLVKELDRLLSLIVHVVSRTIKIKDVALFLLDKETNNYSLKAVRYKRRLPEDLCFGTDDIFIKYIKSRKASIIREEIRSRIQRDGSRNLSELRAVLAKLDELNISVIVPSFVGDLLLGFLVLGEKPRKQMYTQDDLNVFGVLANQAALAIENAVFYQEQGKTLAEKFHEHKVWSIGRMGSGVGHQINNRFQSLVYAADVARTVYLPKIKTDLTSLEATSSMQKLEEALQTFSDEAVHGSEIAVALTNFSRKSQAFKAVALEDVIKGALNLLSCKFKVEELNLVTEISETRPMILGNLAILQDIFMNMLDNAHDAEITRKQKTESGELPEKSYNILTRIKASPDKSKNKWVVDVEDNGIGMTEEELNQMFIPFFTTKATTEKGTGLGMSIIKQMIDAHKGTINIFSKYGEGTKITLTLPVANEINERIF